MKKKPAKLPKIFVQIASYRDSECQWTVKDLFEKAAHPERIFVGICWQFDPKDDQDCFKIPYPKPKQVRVENHHWRDSKGANWARSIAGGLRQDEEYTLIIDAHSRFVSGWDKLVIEQLNECDSPKPILSTFPPSYTPPNDYSSSYIARMTFSHFEYDAKGLLPPIMRYGSITLKPDEVPAKPFLTATISSNFVFAPSRLFDETPIDPHIYFFGDDLNLAARAWTHGWDIFSPNQVVLYHFWQRKERRRHWDDHEASNHRSKMSFQRVGHLVGITHTDEAEALLELDKYNLGKARSLAEYEKFSGVNFSAHTISENAKLGIFTPMLKQTRPKIFVQIASYRDPECQWTVKDLFEKATHPDRIFVGICLQHLPGEDDGIFENSIRPEQVRINYVNAAESKGVCWARSITQSLLQDEEYTLQIDAHMRFEEGWDETMLAMLKNCDSPKPILSTYPQGYHPPDKILSRALTTLGASHFDDDGVIRLGGHNLPENIQLEKPILGGLLSCGFLFASSNFIREVPYDPNLYFYGEEISLAVRAYTHGWDIFYPNKSVIYHYYAHSGHSIRKTHYGDNSEWHLLNAFALKRVKHLLGTEISSDPEVLRKLDVYGLGKKRSLLDYQEFTGIDFKNKTFSADAAKALFRKKKDNMKRPKIFVQIASYRDPECQWTVKDLFEQATYPDRIFVGICWQLIPAEDANLLEVITRPEQVRINLVDAKTSKGACWARSLVQKLWNGEEYTLQIDSHMRFEAGWDETLINMLAECDSPKAVLGTYPPPYTPPDKVTSTSVRRQMADRFDDGVLLIKAGYVTDPEHLKEPIKGAFFSGNFCFGPSAIIKDVPYDPNLYFFGEEISMAVRLWTHGWDFYHPNKVVLYHYWDRSNRATHFKDHDYTSLNQKAFKRVAHMLGSETSDDPEVTKDLNLYGLGKERSLAEYEAYAGVSFARQYISNNARHGIFGTGRQAAPVIHDYVKNIFTFIYENNSWGSAETKSGWGSEIEHTHGIRKFLADFMKSHYISSLVDLGCGDFNWLKSFDLGKTLYKGYDVVEALVKLNKQKYLGSNGTFFCRDILDLEIPKADLIICKDVLAHLSSLQVLKILLNIKKSGSRYLLATCDFSNLPQGNLDITPGDWRALNLTLLPFKLPQPLCIIPHAATTLGLWDLNEVDFSHLGKDLEVICNDYWESYNPIPRLMDINSLAPKLADKNTYFIHSGASESGGFSQFQQYVKKYNWHGLLFQSDQEILEGLKNSYKGHEGLKFENVDLNETPLGDLLGKNKVDSVNILVTNNEADNYKIISQLDFTKFKPDLIIAQYASLSIDDKLSLLKTLNDNGYFYMISSNITAVQGHLLN